MVSKRLLVALRCWIAVLAFTYFGAGCRCFTDQRFMISKFFGLTLFRSSPQPIDPEILEVMHNHWYLLNGVVLVNTFIYPDEKKIIGMAICTLSFYLCFCAMEGFIFKTIMVQSMTICLFVFSGLTLLWLCAGYSHLCSKGERTESVQEDVHRQEPQSVR